MVTEADGTTIDQSNPLGGVRVAIGLAQGIALYALFNAAQSKGWPATNGPLFATLSAVFVFVPAILVSGLGSLRLRLLCGWTLAVTVICAGLGWYDIVRNPGVLPATPRIVPSLQLWLALAAGLFIAQSLLVAGAGDRKFFARYATYFDVSWKYGLQLLLAALFAGIFWLLLWLGAELFRLIKIDFIATIIQKNWFWIPATTLALNCAFHITDVRVSIVRGVRTLSCNLLSWLLPLMTMIALAFVVALVFTGMDPLWQTRRASTILLAAAASLIFLINATYQDGRNIDTDLARSMSRFQRISMMAASAALVPFVLLAAYGIALRVRQYGWTPERIFATACTIVAVCYAVGYVVAAARPNTRFAWVEPANIATAFVILATLLVLFSPIADPARISVADQLRRLEDGRVTPERFDYAFLRFDAGRFGTDALHELAGQKTLAVAAEQSASMLRRQSRYEARRLMPALTPDDIAANITVAQPVGQTLPREFLATDWINNKRSYLIPTCLKARAKCDAVIADLEGNGADDIILLPAGMSSAAVFRKTGGNSWDFFSTLVNVGCRGVRDALIAGQFKIVPPVAKELDVGGQRLRMTWPAGCSEGTVTIKSP